MASMNLDPSSALAEKYKGNRQVLEQAVLGRSGENIDPYSALRALQKLNVADRYEMMQKAMQGQPNPPSVAQQTLAQTAGGVAPQAAPSVPPAPSSGGLAGMPVPEESFNMAGGGLVAFADGGPTYEQRFARFDLSGLTPEQEQEEMTQYQTDIANISKPEEFYGKRLKQLEEIEGMSKTDLQKQKGLAALQAAAAMVQGSDFTRGLGAAVGAFGESYGKAVDAANKEKRALVEMRMNTETAQRQEALGNYKDARAAAKEANSAAKEASKFEAEKLKYLADNELKREQIAATREAATGREKAPSDRMQMYNINLRNAAADIAAKGKRVGETDEAFAQRINLEASRAAAEMTADQWRDMGARETDLTQFKEYTKQLTDLAKNTALQLNNPKEYNDKVTEIQNKINALTARLPSGGTAGVSTLPSGYSLD